jgi:hypothetical protein
MNIHVYCHDEMNRSVKGTTSSNLMILPLESPTGRGYGTSASLEPKASGLPWGYLASRDPFDRGGSKPKVQEAVRRGLLSAYQIDDPDPRIESY